MRAAVDEGPVSVWVFVLPEGAVEQQDLGGESAGYLVAAMETVIALMIGGLDDLDGNSMYGRVGGSRTWGIYVSRGALNPLP